MRIKFVKPGLLTTIQDQGRWNYLALGVPVSGAMDALAANMASIVLGNEKGSAVLEFTYAGACFETETAILMAYAGGGAVMRINDRDLPILRPVYVPAGALVTLIKSPEGCRTYMAVAGGWNIPVVLGSRSTYLPARFGGYQGRAIQAGDVIGAVRNFSDSTRQILKSLQGNLLKFTSWSMAAQQFLPANRFQIRVVPGREFTWFEGGSLVSFLTKPYTLDLRSDRMGYQLNGTQMLRSVKKELLSTATLPGTIQVTGDGRLVILMVDGQTTGGYPRIAHVAMVDLPLCGQLKPGDQIQFSEISAVEAEILWLDRSYQLQKLEIALTNKLNNRDNLWR
ncbi:antagonist of KipI [bacterium A37T11]|nr:antagonist of KipI [bacterium A37T11]